MPTVTFEISAAHVSELSEAWQRDVPRENNLLAPTDPQFQWLETEGAHVKRAIQHFAREAIYELRRTKAMRGIAKEDVLNDPA